VVKNEIINEIEMTRVCSPPRANSLKKLITLGSYLKITEASHIFGFLYSVDKFKNEFKKRVELHFGRFSHKLIRSP
jgi:dsDNA-specific endonuclease/ATPase MutS2